MIGIDEMTTVNWEKERTKPIKKIREIKDNLGRHQDSHI